MDHSHPRYSQSMARPDIKFYRYRVRHVVNIDHFHSQSLVLTMIESDTNMDQLQSDYKLNAG